MSVVPLVYTVTPLCGPESNLFFCYLCVLFFLLQELLEIEAELRKVAAELRELRRG